jgi:hypothetical protein
VIDFALRLRKDEDDAIIEQRRAEIEVARFLNHPVGTQPELPLNMEDRTPGVDKAKAEGEIAGAEGKTCSAPYPAGSPNEQAWLTGWHDGQAILAGAFKKLEAKAAAEPAEEVNQSSGERRSLATGAATRTWRWRNASSCAGRYRTRMRRRPAAWRGGWPAICTPPT